MKDTDYAFAVARIRANENSLLTTGDIERLITAASIRECAELLKSKGYTFDDENGEDFFYALEKQRKKLWTLLNETAPEKEQLKVLCVQNDYFNLKAALKAMITGRDAKDLFAYPTSLDLDALQKAVESHEFSSLPGTMGDCAKEAYETACRTENGQSADVIIDKAALTAVLEGSKQSGCEMLVKIAVYLCACADIKIAYRSAKVKKGIDFVEKALVPVDGIDVKELSEAAAKSTGDVLEYLRKTPFSKEAELLDKSSAAFEKGCDDKMIEIVRAAKYVFFGFEPIVAYYFAKTAELKTVRLILCSKKAKADEQTIRERVRTLYV